MGTTVISGMLAASVIGIFLIPVCYYVVEKRGDKARGGHAAPPPAETTGKEGDSHA